MGKSKTMNEISSNTTLRNKIETHNKNVYVYDDHNNIFSGKSKVLKLIRYFDIE